MVSKIYQLIKSNFGLIFLSVIVTGCLFSVFIDNIAMRLYPENACEIEIKVYFDGESESGCWIELRDYVTNNDLWTLIDESEKSEGWENKKINDSWRWTAVNVNEPETIKFQSKVPGNIDFACGGGKGVVEISCNGQNLKYDLLDDQGDTILPIYRKYSENTYFKATIINCLMFVIAFVLVYLFLNCFIRVLKLDIFSSGFLGKEYGTWTFGVVLAILLIWAFAGYIYGIEQYTTGFGDQGWYWNEGWSVNPFKTSQMVEARFRGYIIPWIYVLFIRGGSISGIPSEIFLIVYLCIIHAGALGVALPRMFYMFSGKVAKLYQILMVVAVYLLFWGCSVMGKGSDGGGICFFILAVWAVCEALLSNKKFMSFFGGIFSAVAISYRMAYKHGLYAFAIVGFVFVVYQAVINKKPVNWKRISILTAGFIMGLVLVSFPQLYSNLKIGTVSLFPYNPGRGEGSSFASASASASIKGTMVFDYPYGAEDKSIAEIPKRYGMEFTDEGWSLNNILCMFSAQWMDTMVFITKKLFFGMSIVKSIRYGSLITGYAAAKYPFAHTTEFAIIPMLNYLLIGGFLYVLFFKKNLLPTKGKCFWGISFLSLVLPQTFPHVEWRYFLVGYMMVYFVVGYHLLEYIRSVVIQEDRQRAAKEINQIAMFEAVFLLLMEVLLWTYY